MIVRNMIKCKKCGDLTPPTPYGVGFRVTIPHFRGRYENACHAISRNRPLGARVPRFLLQQSWQPMNQRCVRREPLPWLSIQDACLMPILLGVNMLLKRLISLSCSFTNAGYAGLHRRLSGLVRLLLTFLIRNAEYRSRCHFSQQRGSVSTKRCFSSVDLHWRAIRCTSFTNMIPEQMFQYHYIILYDFTQAFRLVLLCKTLFGAASPPLTEWACGGSFLSETWNGVSRKLHDSWSLIG